MSKINTNKLYPVLPLRDIVIFPGMVSPLFVGREKSTNALDKATKLDKKIVLVTQKNASQDNPESKDIYRVGVMAQILQLLKLPDGTVKVLVEVHQRIEIEEFFENDEILEAEIRVAAEEAKPGIELDVLKRSVISEFEKYIKLNKKINPDIIFSLNEIDNPGILSDVISSHLTIKIKDKQKILEIFNVSQRLEFLLGVIANEILTLNTEEKIHNRVKKQMEKTQREYFLNEQLKAVQKELGDTDDAKSEVVELEKKIKKTKLSAEAREKANSELKKLKMMSPISAEATIIRNYLDWLLSVPWKNHSKNANSLVQSEEILNSDHYGLEKIKERIIEYVAVSKRADSFKGSILCLVGPPGVGKTSLAKSVAAATGRSFARISLGGVKDESEIRGHRRTYIGALPGKIVQSMKKAKTSNPVILLDEIDKMSSDFRGDPSSALLEVLDPEQNSKFIDHYLEVEYDLSNVMFIATSNSYNIPLPLLDRMEIIRLSGYIEDEKVEIAKRHLVSKQKTQHGLKEEEMSISEEAIREIIQFYTKEAGVRNLEKEIAKICRKIVTKIQKEELSNADLPVKVEASDLKKFLGVRKFSFGEVDKDDQIGVTNGLAYTEVGGDILSIEAVALPGKGNIKTTGKLGEVMQESAQAAFSYFKSNSLEFGITPPQYQKRDIHLHVPEGATPKDGPSAGVAMFTSIVSVLTGVAVKKDVAMTGEITLRGNVLPIGGLKEKLLGALRGGITTVLIPRKNLKDLEEIPTTITSKLVIVPIEQAREALKHALISKLEPTSWKEIEKISNISDEKDANEVITH